MKTNLIKNTAVKTHSGVFVFNSKFNNLNAFKNYEYTAGVITSPSVSSK